MNATLAHVAGQFVAGQALQAITPLGNGLINDTFLVKAAADSFVLQRINPHVFPDPQQVMHNLDQLGQHIQQKSAGVVQLKIPAIIPTLGGQPFFRDENRQAWRALQLISPAESRERIQNVDEAAQIGFALAHFHRLCSDLSPNLLYDTLPGFHITPDYYHQYQLLLEKPLLVSIDSAFRQCQAFIEAHFAKIDVLEQARQNGQLRERVIHGDPKLNNFLFRPDTDLVISLIDLDTVKPGLVHYDIGDCLRSCCHDKKNNHFDLERCQLILKSYLQEAGSFFNSNDYDYLYHAIWLIPFELGLRFFNDYLAGNVYFKVCEPQQNLKRTLAQFALCGSIHQQQQALLASIKRLQQL